MSDLQLSLIGIGALVVAGVYLFNFIQQRRLRRKTESAFRDKPGDALFQSGAEEQGEAVSRIEPTLRQPDTETAPVDASAPPSPADPEIDYIVELSPRHPLKAEAMAPALQRRVDFDKPVRWLGLNAQSGAWEEIQAGRSAVYSSVQGALQLANRAGPVSLLKLSQFRDLANEMAQKLEAVAECPEVEAAQARAARLDGFCADVDVVMVVNIVSKDGAAFPGSKIRGLAEAGGFRLDPDGIFRYPDEEGEVLFSLANQEDAPFEPSLVKTMTTQGVTLLLDVPRLSKAQRAFETMVDAARKLCASLGGVLVDDNRVPLSDVSVRRIRDQLLSLCAKMDQHGIPAGSERALRLFS